jgi:hypothetical protein
VRFLVPLAALLVSLTALLVPLGGVASAAQRWVAPAKQGAGNCTSQANAGTIEEGFATCGGVPAKEGDEIIVTPGTYATKTTLTAPAGGKVHGLAGSPRPTIASTGPTPTLSASSAEVGDLALFNESLNGVALLEGGLAENVLATAAGPGASAIMNAGGATVRDSVAVTSGTNGVALNVGSSSGLMRAENVTAFSTGTGSYGIQATTFAFELFPTCIGGGGMLDGENVIAHGATIDVGTVASVSCGPLFIASITLDHSSFHTKTENPAGTVHDAGANQTTAAQTEPGAIFVGPNAVPADLHELAGAPTIDAGAASMLGPSDPDGNPRTLGPAPDIGAFEFVPPVPPAASTGTPPPPATAPPPGPGVAAAAAARASGAAVLQTLTCSGRPGQACRFAITLTTLERLSGKRVLGVSASTRRKLRKLRVAVGTLTVTVQAGQAVGAVVHLNATGRRLLKRLRRLPVTVTTTTSVAGTPVTLATKKLTLRAPARSHHR